MDPRPHLLVLEDCRQLEFKETTFKNSAYWGLHFVGCEKIDIHHITILNDLKIRNGDGIDFNHSRDAVVRDSYIESGDDCICFKNRREYEEYGDCCRIEIRNCRLISTSCSIKIGSENVNCISDILVKDCSIERSNRGNWDSES